MTESDRLNSRVKDWAMKQQNAMLTNINSLGVVNTGKLFRSLNHRLGMEGGEVERISFKLPRYGFMVEKGVGKGRGINSGKTNPRPWMSRALNDAAISELADIVATESANLAVNATRLLK